MQIKFTVIGDPKGQPRARAFARKMGDKFVARVYDAGTAEGWKSAIAEAIKPFIPAKPLSGPVNLGLVFRFARPKSHYGTGKNAAVLKSGSPLHHTSKPDLDNLEKAVMDCLTKLNVWLDDSQVRLKISRKEWAEVGGADVSIIDLNQVPGRVSAGASPCGPGLSIGGVK